MRTSKKLDVAFLILSLAGIFTGRGISKYCQNRKQIALENPQRVLAIETRRNLEELMKKRWAIEDSNKIVFDNTGRNILYSNSEVGNKYQAIKQKYRELSGAYSRLVCSKEFAANSASIGRYEIGRKLGNQMMYPSLALLGLSGLSLITGKNRININIEYT